ncbi:histidine kinase [Streptomyces sp. NBC_01167]|uniref:histidine kinase n=1 Tax=Streptomyces sp. NBC_01167 TaxID=2903756 RepID=UPI00386D70A3|nr:histidine kinase [Streptomyces sp. NBC_01167]
MSRVDRVGNGGVGHGGDAARRAGAGRRVPTAARAVLRALREDLWSTAARPLPPIATPGRQMWQPAVVVLLVLIAAGIAAFTVNTLAFSPRYGIGTSTALLLGGVQAVALVAAAFRPVVAWWVATAVMAVTAALPTLAGDASAAGGLTPWTGTALTVQAGVLFLLALRLRPRATAGALAVGVVVALLCALLPPGAHPAGFGQAVAILATAAVLGAALRGRQVARSELTVQEELTAGERARRALLEERNRIARELHDVVAHHMSVISIQAQVAPHLVEAPSDELRENLAGIRDSAVEALAELRRVLGVLRSEDAVADGVRHAPQPTLDRLDELIGTVRGAGVSVITQINGERRPLAPGVELSAFRIVQEALSNAMRHAPGARVRVEVGYHASVLAVRVTNTAASGPAPSARDGGHGLLGMRERADMLGGDLVNGPLPDGGYEVLATLPLEDGS